MNFALDTNRYSDLMSGDAAVLARFQAATRVFIPLIVIGELRAGFAAGTKSVANERFLADFLRRASVEILTPDEQTTFNYATIALHLRKYGKMIPANDLWIAALCHQHALPLYTRDTHFNLLPMIATI
jgi:tRNA(fMet)-specific endonuclease VapC